MSDDDNNNASNHATKPTSTLRVARHVPALLKRIFDTFPLITYDANKLPQRALVERGEHVLHVFTTAEEARRGKPSFNPGCLKWQAYLKFSGLSFKVVPSSNHASVTGTLPFLQPAGSDPSSQTIVDPVAGNKLRKWLARQGGISKIEETLDTRYGAYASLLDNRVRKAWLFQLYLAPQNIELSHRLYASPSSSHYFVQLIIASQLRSAAETELIKSAGTNTLSASDLVWEAEEAFRALSTVLGPDEWFSGQKGPGLLDASVFAYTYLILDADLGWKYNPLAEVLSKYQNLVQHRKRIADAYFG